VDGELIARGKAIADSGRYEPPPDDDGPEQNCTPILSDRILTRSALLTLPDPEPLIDDVLDQGTTGLLYGSWGTAKSFIALDWAASVATAHRWQGRDTVQRRVLYVAGEGAFGFKGRIAAWEIGWQTKIADEWLHILPQAVNLTRASEVDQLRALIDWGGYSFIVLDTLARCSVGGDENSARDTGIVVDAMTKCLQSTPDGRGVVLGVHHAGKDGKTLRGSSAYESAADTVYFTARDGQVITLDREKRKDGPEMDRHELKLGQIEGTGSCVIESHRGGANTSRAKQLILIYSQCFAATGCTGVQLRDVAEMKKDTFYRALSDLLESGELINLGTSQRPFYRRRGDEDSQ
jgi:AAA domain